MRPLRPALLPLAALLAAAALAAEGSACPQGPTADAVALVPGRLFTGELDALEAPRRAFYVDVPPTAVALRVRLSCLEAQLDLLGRVGARIETGEDADLVPDESTGEQVITLDRFSDPPIAPGRVWFEVYWGWRDLPEHGGRGIRDVPFSLRAELFHVRVDGELPIGGEVRGTVDPAEGGFRTFRVDVPPGARCLRLDLVDARDDLALLAAPGHPVLALGPGVHDAGSVTTRKTLRITPESDPPLAPGPWYVDVALPGTLPRRSPFRLLAVAGPDPPAELLEIPPFPAPRSARPLDRALPAVVEVVSVFGEGSGTLVSPSGLVLTAAHVVESPAGGPDPTGAVIAVSLDVRRPSVELFRARIARYDRARDLALLAIDRGFYGQPLPEGYTFPTVPLGEPERLRLGDPLWFLGFPATGGTGSRPTITVTRGIVSGFDEGEAGLLLKTDGEITGGSSGGAVLDELGRLVGVPGSVVEYGSSQLGFVQPLWLLPQEWRAEIESACLEGDVSPARDG